MGSIGRTGWLLVAGVPLLLAGCGHEQPAAPPRPTLAERFEGGTPIVGTQDEHGGWRPPDVGRRSSFEQRARDNGLFKGEFSNSKRSFTQAEREFASRPWWGTDGKQLAKPAYATGAVSGMDKVSSMQGQRHDALGSRAREAGQQEFAAPDYATGRAREQSGRRFGHPQDAETEARRSVYPQPEITDWQAQRGLSVGETKSMLGGR